MNKTIIFIFFLFLLNLIPINNCIASDIKIAQDDFIENSDNYHNFFGPKFFLVKEYPDDKNINIYLDEVFYLGVIPKDKVREFSNPIELKNYIDKNFPNYKSKFYKNYEYLLDNEFKETRKINRVSYLLNEKIYYSVEFIQMDIIPSPQIEGPKSITYDNSLKSLTDLFNLFNYYSPLGDEQLYKPKFYKIIENSEVYVSHLAKITSDGGDYLIKKYFLGYGEITLKIKLVRNNENTKFINKINNDIVINLLNKRPTEDTLLLEYKKELNKLGIYPDELTIKHSTYSKFDKSNNDDFMLIGYKLNNLEYEDKFIITKNALKKENKILRYNLYISSLIAGLAIIYGLYPIIKRIIIKSNLKRKSKKIKK